MLKNRVLSFLILAFVYAVACFGGIILFKRIPLDYRLALLIADVFATILVFVFSIVFPDNYADGPMSA